MTLNTIAEQLTKVEVEQAIKWKIELTEHGDNHELIKQFEAWYSEHHHHAIAWQRINNLNSDIKQQVNELSDKRVVIPVVNAAAQKMQRRSVLKLLSLSAISVSTIAINSEFNLITFGSNQYSTANGETKHLTLADGTDVILNTDSAIHVDYTQNERCIELIRGEVFVTSGSDVTSLHYRPLIVQVDYARFRAVGTQFLVRKNERFSQLSVSEGQVAIERNSGSSTLVDVGERYTVYPESETLSNDSALDFTSWTKGYLSVIDISLADFLKELSRYRSGYLYCEPAIENLRLSGVFQLDDPEKILSLLPELLPIKVKKRTRFWVKVVSV